MKKLVFLTAGLFLVGCQSHTINNNYNEFRKETTCSLSNNRIQTIWDFKGTQVSFNLITKNGGKEIMFLVENFGSAGVASFKMDSRLNFTVVKQNGQSEEISLVAVLAEDPSPVFIVTSRGVLSEQVKLAMGVITREQISKIAEAKLVKFAFETYTTPIKGELSGEDLKPFQDFLSQCCMR